VLTERAVVESSASAAGRAWGNGEKSACMGEYCHGDQVFLFTRITWMELWALFFFPFCFCHVCILYGGLVGQPAREIPFIPITVLNESAGGVL
jgi:hypothetical protein